MIRYSTSILHTSSDHASFLFTEGEAEGEASFLRSHSWSPCASSQHALTPHMTRTVPSTESLQAWFCPSSMAPLCLQAEDFQSMASSRKSTITKSLRRQMMDGVTSEMTASPSRFSQKSSESTDSAWTPGASPLHPGLVDSRVSHLSAHQSCDNKLNLLFWPTMEGEDSGK